MKLLAIDVGPSTCGVAVCALEGGTVRHEKSYTRPSGLESIDGMLAFESPDVVAIESPKGYIFSPARGAQLLATARIAGGIAWLAQAKHHRVIELSAAEWRKTLVGRATAKDDAIAEAVSANVAGMPTTTNVHVRDALGMAVVAAWIINGQAGVNVPQKGKPSGKRAHHR